MFLTLVGPAKRDLGSCREDINGPAKAAGCHLVGVLLKLSRHQDMVSTLQRNVSAFRPMSGICVWRRKSRQSQRCTLLIKTFRAHAANYDRDLRTAGDAMMHTR